MNQRRSSIVTRDSSVDGHPRSSLHATNSNTYGFSVYPQSARQQQQFNFQENFQLNFLENSSVSSQKSPIYHSISRSVPVQRPRAETAYSYNGADFSFFRENGFSDYQPENPGNHISQRFYSAEEHHDDFSFCVPNDPERYRNLSIAIPNSSHGHLNEKSSDLKLAEEVNLLLASHLNLPINVQPPYTADQRENHQRYSEANLLKFPKRAQQSDQFSSDIQATDRLYKKPQIYRANDRKVERITYHPAGNQYIHAAYPIVELSVPNAAGNEDQLTDVPYIDQEAGRTVANSNFRTRNLLSNGSVFSNQYQQVKQQTNTYPSHGEAAPVNSSFSGKQTANSNIQNTPTAPTSAPTTPTIDYSSLDAFLDGSLLQEEDMSRSTKEWRSSFSSMRNRFGHMLHASDEPVSSIYDFSTNGSLSLPKRALAKSASQGSLTVGRYLDSNERQRSLLSNAVERRRAAEAPELRRPGSRRELGDFWTETLKNHSVAQRTSSPLTAAQRLEMLHESVNDSGRRTTGRRFSGETLATRKANFLKEAVKSASSLMDRVITGRSTPIPSANNEKHTLQIEINENNGGRANAPNFAALDSAVAELNNSDYSCNRSSGCARFPTDDLSSLSPVGKVAATTSISINGAAASAHSPSPEATSDASSSYSAPSGLPHPKPKHNIREQLIQAGFEPRGRVSMMHNVSAVIYVNRSAVRFGSAPNFPVPSNGSVASRISEFEKKPGAPNLLQIACALNGTERQRNEVSPIRSPLGPMSPRSSIYRTKPVIHADIGGPSPHASQVPTNSGGQIFEFPPSKQLTEIKDEIPYRNIESSEATTRTAAATETTNGELKTEEVSKADKVALESPPVKRRSKAKSKTSSQNERSKSPRSTAERRSEKKKSVAKVSIIEPTTNSAVSGDATVLQNRTAKIEPELPTTPALPKIPIVNVPRFFFPNGVPVSMAENEAALKRVSNVFGTVGNKVEMIDMAEVCRAAGIPMYWKRAVYDSCCNYQSRPITLADFASWWNRMTSVAHDEAARFVYTLAGPHRNYLTKEDFAPILQDLIETFPGLHFLREAQEFHSRYVETVTVRIFWAVNRQWTGRITVNELRRSNFLETVRKLETTDDINAITNYFSYEHFYVIYCKFYELDKDHDLIINKIDMSQHANGALPSQIIDRIFSGAVTRAPARKRVREVLETIGYTDFVAFLLAEEDKRHPTSVEYWFRCLDLDGDGLLSLYEMEYFYNGVKSKMDQHNIDSMRFDDVVCNLLDLIRPKQPNAISLSDLKKCPLCTRFFNTFVNWVKYYEQEASEGERATVTDGEEELNDWDRYCLEEYEALMADDQENDEPEDINLNLDDEDDLLLNGTNVSTTVNMSLHDFGDSQRTKILEAI